MPAAPAHAHSSTDNGSARKWTPKKLTIAIIAGVARAVHLTLMEKPQTMPVTVSQRSRRAERAGVFHRCSAQ